MNVIAHNAQSIEFETEFVESFLESVQQHLAALMAGKAEFAIVAAGSNVIAVPGLELARTARHGVM